MTFDLTGRASALRRECSTARGTGGAVAAALALPAMALGLRVRLAGIEGARSVPAGLCFGLVLLAGSVWLSRRHGVRGASWRVDRRGLALGVAGAAVLCAPAAVRHLIVATPAAPLTAYPVWAAVVALVAVAEEAVLRGVLWTAAVRWRGTRAALVLTSVAFALLHVPLYGWRVVPLDLSVGLVLGVLRAVSGRVAAPAAAHALADLAGWWLR